MVASYIAPEGCACVVPEDQGRAGGQAWLGWLQVGTRCVQRQDAAIWRYAGASAMECQK